LERRVKKLTTYELVQNAGGEEITEVSITWSRPVREYSELSLRNTRFVALSELIDDALEAGLTSNG
jgi:hypothetical protein